MHRALIHTFRSVVVVGLRSFSFTFYREQKGQTINKQREFISSKKTGNREEQDRREKTGNREDRRGERERERRTETETRKKIERVGEKLRVARKSPLENRG